jgi:spermidine/putrescine transport system substrate-binding protein
MHGDDDRPRALSRRSALRLGGLGLTGAAFGLAGCARQTPASPAVSGGGSATSTGLQIASPASPVTWPILTGNEPIAAGRSPERGATLQLYNYPDYINPDVVKSFEAKYKSTGVKVVVSTFNDTNEALAKIRSGGAAYDIYFPSYDAVGKLATTGLVRPLTHDYLPNIKNVWPQFQNPFYDGEWRYTVPYTVYTTGIGWRADRISEDIGARANPYDVFWDSKFAGRISVLDDYREVQSMVILREGGTDINTGDPAALTKVRDDLLALAAASKPQVTITDYTALPEGKLDICQAWSGDMVSALGYLPKGTEPSVLRYWFPADGKGVVNNDLMVVLRGGKNPVLAHLFLDYLLDPGVALKNFSFVGYQPPQVSVDPNSMVKNGLVPKNLASVTVRQSDFDTGYRTLELPPDVEARWQDNWTRFKAGA